MFLKTDVIVSKSRAYLIYLAPPAYIKIVELIDVLRAFLLEYTDVDEGIESLLDNGLWSCVAVIVPRSAHNSEVTAKFLTESKADWPTERASHIVRILAGICWSTLPHNAEELLSRMAYFLPHLQSTSHIATFARIAEEQMNR